MSPSPADRAFPALGLGGLALGAGLAGCHLDRAAFGPGPWLALPLTAAWGWLIFLSWSWSHARAAVFHLAWAAGFYGLSTCLAGEGAVLALAALPALAVVGSFRLTAYERRIPAWARTGLAAMLAAGFAERCLPGVVLPHPLGPLAALPGIGALVTGFGIEPAIFLFFAAVPLAGVALRDAFRPGARRSARVTPAILTAAIAVLIGGDLSRGGATDGAVNAPLAVFQLDPAAELAVTPLEPDFSFDPAWRGKVLTVVPEWGFENDPFCSGGRDALRKLLAVSGGPLLLGTLVEDPLAHACSEEPAAAPTRISRLDSAVLIEPGGLVLETISRRLIGLKGEGRNLTPGNGPALIRIGTSQALVAVGADLVAFSPFEFDSGATPSFILALNARRGSLRLFDEYASLTALALGLPVLQASKGGRTLLAPFSGGPVQELFPGPGNGVARVVVPARPASAYVRGFQRWFSAAARVLAQAVWLWGWAAAVIGSRAAGNAQFLRQRITP